MNLAIHIEADGAILYLQGIPRRVTEQLRDAITRETIRLANIIKSEKLSGQVLRTRTGNLRRATGSEPTTITPTGVEGSVVVDRTAPYGKVHEYGGRITIREHARRTPSGGVTTVSAHEAIFPERSFLRSALREQRDSIASHLRDAIGRALTA